jgi:hypothetical protein
MRTGLSFQRKFVTGCAISPFSIQNTPVAFLPHIHFSNAIVPDRALRRPNLNLPVAPAIAVFTNRHSHEQGDLDVTIQAQVIDLLMELQERHQLSYLFITHDLSVVNQIADRIAVMRQGRIVEEGEAARVIRQPEHEYTRQLLAAVPVPGGKRRRSSSPGA